MKKLLIISAILICASCFLILQNTQQASAVPVSYNVSSLAIPFQSYTRGGFEVLVDSGYNGTVNAVYDGRGTNNTLNYEFGYHPTLPLTVDQSAISINATLSVAATQTGSVTISSSNNNVVVVPISFLHINNTNHNQARISSVTIGTIPFVLAINKTVTCGLSVCDSEIWYMGNVTLTGVQTITVTPASVTTYNMQAGGYTFHNARTIHPFSSSGSSTALSNTPLVNLTPTFQSSAVLDNVAYDTASPGKPTSHSNSTGYQSNSPYGSTLRKFWGASQYGNPSVFGSNNAMSWVFSGGAVNWADTAIEVVPIQNQVNFGYNLAFTVVNGGSQLKNMISNGSNVYYPANNGGNAVYVQHIDVNTGIESHDWTVTNAGRCTPSGAGTNYFGFFVTQSHIFSYCARTNESIKTYSGGNTTSASTSTITSISDMKIVTTGTFGQGDKFNSNSTGFSTDTVNTNPCELTFIPTNTTTTIDSIACDGSIPNEVKRYWNGMLHQKIGNYYQNTTLSFLGYVDLSPYKKQLTVPAEIYGIPGPDVKVVGHWDKDYLISESSSAINYIDMPTLTHLFAENRAFQSYDLTLVSTDTHYYLSPSRVSPVQPLKFYGQILNVTASKYGMVTLPSGYTMRTTTFNEGIVRTVDPRWTNNVLDIPAITTQSSLFPIILTVSNAPTDSSLMLVDEAQVIQNVNSVWCVVQLDTTHSTECDVPAGQCPLIYIADISLSPVVYNFEGTVCATGPNTKTIAYTNTLPLTFYTQTLGATHTYVPSSSLSTTVRSTNFPFTYNVLVKNSTGAIAINSTYTINGTIDTENYNVSSVTKPASLFISVSGQQIYSAYLGSPLSLASTAAFFHTYFNYQGFDLLSFIPLIFASMFTRNTVGVGAAMTVVLIATLSWLSVVVVSDTVVYISIIIAAIGIIGYRAYGT